MEPQQHILAINGGSSSVKFALFDANDPSKKLFAGKVDASDAVEQILQLLQVHSIDAHIVAIGHRVVSGGQRHSEHAMINDELLSTLEDIEVFDPDHLPGEISLINDCRAKFPDVPQVACFDTAFFKDLPRVAQILPIPRSISSKASGATDSTACRTNIS